MRIQYWALLAAAALAASAHGLQVVSYSVSPLHLTDEARQQPYIKDKTKRFLTGEDKELVTSTGYASRSLQEGDNGGHLHDYYYDSDLEPIDEERKMRFKRKGLKKKKRKGLKKKKRKSIFSIFKKWLKNDDEEEVDDDEVEVGDDEEEVDDDDKTEAPTAEPLSNLTESNN